MRSHAYSIDFEKSDVRKYGKSNSLDHCSRNQCCGRSDADQLTIRRASNVSGDRRAGVYRARLTNCASAKSTAGQNVHAAVLGGHQTLALVQQFESIFGCASNVLGLVVRTLLDREDLPALLGQLRRDDSSASSGPDDQDVRVKVLERRRDLLKRKFVVLAVARLVGEPVRISGRREAGGVDQVVVIGVDDVQANGCNKT